MRFSIETTIARPPAAVYEYATDPERLSTWQPLVVEVERLAPDRLREVREVRGRRIEQIVEVTAAEPGRRFSMRVVEGPLPIDGDMTFSGDGEGGTRLRLDATGRLTGGQRLLAPLLRLGLRREFAKQYRTLKARLEAPA